MPDTTTGFGFRRADFPQGFTFGAATSAYQIEGARFGGAGPSHWDTFAATPGNTVRAEDGRLACDHYHRWPADLDLVRDAGLDAYRFSISWARVMPEGRGTPNAEGLDFYDRLVDGMLARGLAPWATLYHWELPAALADLGGWRNRDVAGWFADYTALVMARLGDRIHATAPVNEPWCVAWLSHFLGHHAPGLRDIRAAARAMHHVLLAHGRAIEVMRGLGLGNLGAVMNFEYALPADESAESEHAARLYDGIYNRWFVGGVLERAYPEDVLEGLGPHMPDGWQDDMALIGQDLDWIGINYYTCKRLAANPESPWPGLREAPGPLPTTDMGWEICPDGLLHFLTRLKDLTSGRLPIVVTENGLAAATPLEDRERIAYLEAHLGAARQAIAEGVPLAGYFIWSLLDNYEWAFGYEKRFGLVHVDFETLERTPKASWHALRRAMEREPVTAQEAR
ncbi:GH1 family beta-glucosidase [Rhodobacteraceae bacterium DSL-40]|uniref:GH1 family beta-glucosidase n=1 Tax=Amaricoccus sp. B4 TaxID=3368557 RepID=UPI000DAEBF03